MTYTLHPEAVQDLREAAEFYRDQAGNALSQALFAEFERSLAVLLRHPALGALWRRSKRRFVMRRFPYSIIYTASGEEVRVLALAHHNRRPGYWRGRK